MRVSRIAPHLAALLLCGGLTGGMTAAAGMTVPLPAKLTLPPTGTPQWTFKLNLSVDHIPPQFVAAGAYCAVTGAQGAGVAAGYAEQPLSGGAYSGAVSVPAYLSNGQVAGNGKAWNCILSLRDAQGKITYPNLAGPGDPAAPKPGSNPQLIQQAPLF
jgi:hypothetical protein